MTEKTGCAVLRFIAQNNYCHMIHDYVEGHTVMEYAKENVILEKKKIFSFIKELAVQMEQFYKCEEEVAYGYLNPYAVIVTEDEKVSLLDIWAEENKEQLERMQKKKIRALFVSPEYVLSQRKRREDDLYGFGKTVQFLVENCCGRNVLTYRENYVLQKIYGKCLSGEKADVSKWKTIQKLAEKLLVERKKEGRLFPYLVIGIAVLSGFICGILAGSMAEAQEDRTSETMVAEMGDDTHQIELAEEHLQIGLEYLLLDERSELGMEWLGKAGTVLEKANYYNALFEYLNKDMLSEDEKEQLQILLDEELDALNVEETYCYQFPIMKAYRLLENEEGWNRVISLGNMMEKTKEVRLYLAEAYEKCGKYEAALVEYEQLKSMVWKAEELRFVYEKLMELYDSVDLKDKISAIYEEAVTIMPTLETDETFIKWKQSSSDEVKTE